VKNTAENKKPATSCDFAGERVAKIRFVAKLGQSDCTHPCQPWLGQQQAHGRPLLARVEAFMSKCYLQPTAPFTSDAEEAERIHRYQGLSPPSTGKLMNIQRRI
jgi:hypothetical protein